MCADPEPEAPATVVITNHSKPFVYVAIAGVVAAVAALAIVVYVKTSAATATVVGGEGATRAATDPDYKGDRVNRVLDFADETAPDQK